MQVDGTTYMNELVPKHSDLPNDIMARYKDDVNVLAGAYYISDLPYDSWQAKLRAYNSGPDCTDPSNPDPIKATSKGQQLGTPNYPSKILGYAKKLEDGTLNW